MGRHEIFAFTHFFSVSSLTHLKLNLLVDRIGSVPLVSEHTRSAMPTKSNRKGKLSKKPHQDTVFRGVGFGNAFTNLATCESCAFIFESAFCVGHSGTGHAFLRAIQQNSTPRGNLPLKFPTRCGLWILALPTSKILSKT